MITMLTAAHMVKYQAKYAERISESPLTHPSLALGESDTPALSLSLQKGSASSSVGSKGTEIILEAITTGSARIDVAGACSAGASGSAGEDHVSTTSWERKLGFNGGGFSENGLSADMCFAFC